MWALCMPGDGMTIQDTPAQGNRLGAGIGIVLFSTIIWATAGLFVRLLPFDIWSIVVWRNCFAVLFVGSYVLWRLRRSAPAGVLPASSGRA